MVAPARLHILSGGLYNTNVRYARFYDANDCLGVHRDALVGRGKRQKLLTAGYNRQNDKNCCR